MQLLASCSLEQSINFNGKLVIPNEDQKKPDKVFLNVVVGEDESARDVFKRLNGTEKCVTFCESNPTNFCPTGMEGKVFNECSLDTLVNSGTFPEISGVVTLVRLPRGYCDMRFLRSLCEKHPSVRFIGGNLLGVDGVKIGRFDEGKDKMPPVFKDIYDTFVEVDLNDLDGLQEIVKKTRKRAEGSVSMQGKKEPKEKKEKKQPKRLEAFNRLFDGEEEF